VHEVKRHGSGKLGYVPDSAQRVAAMRPLRGSKIGKHYWLRHYIVEGLSRCWSPQQIAGRIRYDKKHYYACMDTIYRYIYSPDGIALQLHKQLPKRKPYRKFKHKDRRGIMPYAISIHEREAPRTTPGHWEGDLVLFRFNNRRNIITLVERTTRYTTLLAKYGKYNDRTIAKIKDWMQHIPAQAVESITFDQGREFTQHHQLEVPTFFCDPGAPHQKGTNENTNGRLRRFLPKHTNPNITQELLDKIQNIMNNTPRKCLNYQTPQEAFNTAFHTNWCTST